MNKGRIGNGIERIGAGDVAANAAGEYSLAVGTELTVT